MTKEILSPPAESRIIGRARFWRTLILALLVIGYTGYYLCRSSAAAAFYIRISRKPDRQSGTAIAT
jgi:hypothetical protein